MFFVQYVLKFEKFPKLFIYQKSISATCVIYYIQKPIGLDALGCAI